MTKVTYGVLMLTLCAADALCKYRGAAVMRLRCRPAAVS